MRFLSWLFGYFYLPCPVCGRKFSGMTWGHHRDDMVWTRVGYQGNYVYDRGIGVCSKRCAELGRHINELRDAARYVMEMTPTRIEGLSVQADLTHKSLLADLSDKIHRFDYLGRR